MTAEIYYDEDRNIIPMPLEAWKKQLEEKESETNNIDGKVLDAYGTVLARHEKNGDMYLKTEFFKKA